METALRKQEQTFHVDCGMDEEGGEDKQSTKRINVPWNNKYQNSVGMSSVNWDALVGSYLECLEYLLVLVCTRVANPY